MTEELTPETFDLAEALSGQTYPKEVVTIPLDREAAQEVLDARRELKAARDEEDDDLIEVAQRKYDEVVARVKKSSLTVTVQSISQDAQKSLQISTQEIVDRKPSKSESEDLNKFNVLRGEEIMTLTWAAYIIDIRNSSGQTTDLSRESIGLLVTGLVDSNAELIQNAIKTLDREASQGFEAIAKDLDF